MFLSGVCMLQKVMPSMGGRPPGNADGLVVSQYLTIPKERELAFTKCLLCARHCEGICCGISFPVVWWEPQMTKSVLFTVIHEFLINLLGEFMKSEEVEHRN